MQLSLRLCAIADMVTEGNKLVDVGCDHGYLPVYLLLNKKIPSAVAVDVRKGPLSRAEEHISQYGLEAYIETRLSDGLSAVKPGEGDTLVIAGMGGPLMERILTEGKEVRETFREMILQPQSDIPHFRHFIRKEGWEIVKEEMILEDGKFYPIMKVLLVKKENMEKWTKEEEMFGKHLLAGKHPVLKQYLERELRIRNEILERLSNVSKGTAEARMQEVKEEKEQIEAALKRYESM